MAEDTRELAAQRAQAAHNADLPAQEDWEELDEGERDVWRRVADSVLATLDWCADAAIVGRIDDIEDRLRRLEQAERGQKELFE